jgi:hypothetical protein
MSEGHNDMGRTERGLGATLRTCHTTSRALLEHSAGATTADSRWRRGVEMCRQNTPTGEIGRTVGN